MLLLSWILKLRNERERHKIMWWEVVGILLLVMAISSCKAIFFVAALAVLLLPNQLFTVTGKGVVYKLLCGAAAIVMGCGWTMLASSKYMSLTRSGGNSAERVQYCLVHPFYAVRIVWNTIAKEAGEWLLQALGYPRPYIHNKVIILLIFVLLLMTLVLDLWKCSKPDWKTALCYLCIFAILFTLTFAGLYLTYTPGAPEDIIRVEGVQGRYFTPMVIPVLLAIICGGYRSADNGSRMENIEMKETKVLGASLCLLLCGVVSGMM